MTGSYAAAFIDGGYLDHVLRNHFGQARIDYGALARTMAGSYELLRTYYYHCLPYQGSPPTEEEKTRFSGMEQFLNRLRRLDRFEVRVGKLAYRGVNASGARIFEQKRVDSMLSVDLVLLSAKRVIRKAVILTGDSDFLPPIWAAKNEGVIVHLWHGFGDVGPHRELWDAVDERTQITKAIIDKILRP